MCRSFDWRDKTGYNCALSHQTKNTQPQAYSCRDDQWSYSEKVEDSSFTTTKCDGIGGFNEGGTFNDQTWEECKTLCLKDDMCRSFDWRDKTGYNCALSHQTKDTQPQAYFCRDDQWNYNEKVEE